MDQTLTRSACAKSAEDQNKEKEGVLDVQFNKIEQVLAKMFEKNLRIQASINRILNPRPHEVSVPGGEVKSIGVTVESRLVTLLHSLVLLDAELLERANDLDSAV